MYIKKKIIPYIIFIVLISVFATAATLEFRRQEGHTRENMVNELSSIENNIYTIVQSRMINAHALAGLIEIKNKFTKNDYEVFAKKIFFQSHSIIKSIVFIEDTSIRFIYPDDNYDTTVGVDLSLIDEQKKLIELSKSTGKSVITPKFKLVEGGEGVVIRVPLFIDSEYKGQVSMAFEYNELIEAIGIKKASQKFYIKIDVLNDVSNKASEIWSNYTFNDDYSLTKSFRIDDSDIIIYAKPKKSLLEVSLLFYFLVIFGSLFSFYASFLAFKQFKLSSQLIDANELLKKKTIFDDLTGLLNRRAFFEQTSIKILNSKFGSIAIMDLNNFKYINDLHGHDFGDNLLVDTSNFLLSKYRKFADVYRIGGDEFAIVFTHNELTKSEYESLINSLNSSILSLSENLQVDAALGLIHFPNDGVDINSLFLKVDLALQASKSSSKKLLVSYSDILLENFSKKAEIEKFISKAIENQDFEMYYQPIYYSNTMVIESFEALVRLNSRKYTPDQFISVAEETQLILPLGYWIIEEVFKNIVSISKKIDFHILETNIGNQRINLLGFSFAINISSVQLYDSSFISKVIELLNKYNIDPSIIKFEITESVFLHKSHELNESIEKLRHLGILISLDDFGTGYSSINYLTYLPLDIVKLDKSLKDKFIDEEYNNVLSGIITMLHGLNMKVVVEGIESEFERDLMIKLKCDYLQGYHMSKPLAFKELTRIILDKIK